MLPVNVGMTVHLQSDYVFFNVQNVEDNHEEAARVAPQALRLCQLVSDLELPFAII